MPGVRNAGNALDIVKQAEVLNDRCCCARRQVSRACSRPSACHQRGLLTGNMMAKV